jgi:hypothetical protein
MLMKKHLRIFFLIATLLFAQHAAALHAFAHLNQSGITAQQADETKQDGDISSKKLCELCLALAELGNGIVSTSAVQSFQQNHFHFSAADQVDFFSPLLFAFHSRAPPAQ